MRLVPTALRLLPVERERLQPLVLLPVQRREEASDLWQPQPARS